MLSSSSGDCSYCVGEYGNESCRLVVIFLVCPIVPRVVPLKRAEHCRWLVTNNDVDLGSCVSQKSQHCSQPSTFLVDASEWNQTALSHQECLETCCAADCSQHGKCDDTNVCECDILHDGPICESVNWIIVGASVAVFIVVAATVGTIWVRSVMKRRAARPRLNSATEQLLLNPAAVETLGGDFSRVTEAEASKLTKLRQDLHLRTLEVHELIWVFCLSIPVSLIRAVSVVRCRSTSLRFNFVIKSERVPSDSSLARKFRMHKGARPRRQQHDSDGVLSRGRFYRGSKVAVKMVQSFAHDRETAMVCQNSAVDSMRRIRAHNVRRRFVGGATCYSQRSAADDTAQASKHRAHNG